MKIVYTMEEARMIISEYALDRFKSLVECSAKPAQFIHVYSDRSGSTDVENLYDVMRVEVEIEVKAKGETV